MSESSYYCHEAGTNCKYVDDLRKELQKSNWHSERHLINIQSLNKTISELSNLLHDAEKPLHHREGVCLKCQDNAVMYVPISSVEGLSEKLKELEAELLGNYERIHLLQTAVAQFASDSSVKDATEKALRWAWSCNEYPRGIGAEGMFVMRGIKALLGT